MSAARRSPRPDLLSPAPWLRVRRVALIHREIREFVPASTVELLLQGAELVVEGAPELGTVGAQRRAFASLMVTLDLRRNQAAFREPPDSATAHRVADLLVGHPDLHARLESRLRTHLAALLAQPPDRLGVSCEFTVQARGCCIYIDADACGQALEEVGS